MIITIGRVSKLIFSARVTVVTCHIEARGTKRSTRLPPGGIPKRSGYNPQNLTPENRAFLQDVTLDIAQERSPLVEEPWERGVWTPESKRTSLICKKIGVLPQWDKTGKRFMVTLLQVADNHVVNYIDPSTWQRTSRRGKKEGQGVYGCLVVGAESYNPQVFKAGYLGLFEKSGVAPKKRLHSFLITPDAKIEPGTPLVAQHFTVGQYVDVHGRTTGHGFQGVMKRWHFKGGQSDKLGATKSHRRPGAIGTTGGGVRLGKHMPGHMGCEFRASRGLKIWRINTKYNVLYVHGQAIPGPTHHYVLVKDSVCPNKMVKDPPFPTYYPDEAKADEAVDEVFDPQIFQFSSPSVSFADLPDEPTARSIKIKKQAKAKRK